jgi:hypothetical protein
MLVMFFALGRLLRLGRGAGVSAGIGRALAGLLGLAFLATAVFASAAISATAFFLGYSLAFGLVVLRLALCLGLRLLTLLLLALRWLLAVRLFVVRLLALGRLLLGLTVLLLALVRLALRRTLMLRHGRLGLRFAPPASLPALWAALRSALVSGPLLGGRLCLRGRGVDMRLLRRYGLLGPFVHGGCYLLGPHAGMVLLGLVGGVGRLLLGRLRGFGAAL